VTLAASTVRTDYGSLFAVRAAIMAPSVHNTQPWYFVGRPEGISLYADRARGLPLTDPAGRELVISCGAALFNLSVAMQHLGFTPNVHLLPNQRYDDPPDWEAPGDLLAETRWGRYRHPGSHDERLFRAVTLRHTHRGPFLSSPVPPLLIAQLTAAVHSERADLAVIDDPERRRLLAELTGIAEAVHRSDPRLVAELDRWVPPRGSRRRDGVPACTYPYRPIDQEFAGRDFTHGLSWESAVHTGRPQRRPSDTVVLLTTRGDRMLDWILAGRALQRLLLHAAAYRLAAAFHTQALELPDLRERIRTEVTGGRYPQMLLRIGQPPTLRSSSRRALSDVITVRPVAGTLTTVPEREVARHVRGTRYR
jgi:hypothetical protein